MKPALRLVPLDEATRPMAPVAPAASERHPFVCLIMASQAINEVRASILDADMEWERSQLTPYLSELAQAVQSLATELNAAA